MISSDTVLVLKATAGFSAAASVLFLPFYLYRTGLGYWKVTAVATALGFIGLALLYRRGDSE